MSVVPERLLPTTKSIGRVTADSLRQLRRSSGGWLGW